MANRDLITKGITLENLKNKAFNPDSVAYKELIKELIRLDIPILEIGSSSIGKSYSIRQFMEEAGIRGEFLFVGTEKSEFIEGIPNLKAVTEGQAKFSYLQPYWFPDKNKIRERLKNGKQQILDLSAGDSTVEDLWEKSKTDYAYINQLKETLLSFRRTEEEVAKAKKAGSKIGKYVYEDALLYISTLQGYGNFWLILDEIDKVEKQDKDKYAPLLHIVRERELKGWKLSGMRDFPEYDIKYVTAIDTRIARLDAALNDESVDVTDTRIIAIANDLQTMEEEAPALYRRFVKIAIRKSLYDEKQSKLPSGDPTIAVGYDYAKEYDVKKNELHKCIVAKEVIGEDTKASTKAGVKSKGKTIEDQMAEIDEEKIGKPLEEMNLQWTLGFFPEILFPGGDIRGQGTQFIQNKIIEDFNDVKDPYQTLLFKVIGDNFDMKYWIPLLECLYDKISIKQVTESKATGISAEADSFFADAGITKASFGKPIVKNVEQMLDRYQKKLSFVESKFKESIDIQKQKMRGEDVPDTVMAGVVGGTNAISKDAIVLGNILIEKSMDGNKPTELTRLLISAIPFQQVRFISTSPYIPFDSAKDLMEIHDNGLVNFIMKVSGKGFSNEAEAKAAAENVFTAITPYRPFIVKYAIGASPEDIDLITEGDYGKIKDKSEVIRKIIQNKPVIIDPTLVGLIPPSKEGNVLKEEYFGSLANVKMVEKEVYQNLSYEVWPMIKKSNSEEGLTPALQEEVRIYCQKYPVKMTVLADSLDGGDPKEAALRDFIDNNISGTGAEIDTINSDF